MRCYQGILKISYEDGVTDDDAHRMMKGKKRKKVVEIKKKVVLNVI